MKRIDVLDGLRGLALLGILLVNIIFFNQSYMAISYGGVPVEGWLNRTIETISSLLVNGKFMLLFSFLFGYGAVILLQKSTASDKRFAPLFIKRMLVLLLFGILHGVLIWHGDILTAYALIGFILLLFIRRSPRTLLITAIICTLLVPALMAAFTAASPQANDAVIQNQQTFDPTAMIQFAQQKDQLIYGAGSWTEIMQQRLTDYISGIFNMILFIPQILGAFLLGAYFSKRNLLSDIGANKRTLIRLGLIGGVLGIALQLPSLLSASSNTNLEMISVFIAGPLLMLSYVSLFTLAFIKYKKQLQWFTYPGRIGFSMYILQSILCSIIFYSYGFGMFGKMELWQTTVTALFIYTLQVLISMLWLRYFKTGPLEYVWRLCYRGKTTRNVSQRIESPFG